MNRVVKVISSLKLLWLTGLCTGPVMIRGKRAVSMPVAQHARSVGLLPAAVGIRP